MTTFLLGRNPRHFNLRRPSKKKASHHRRLALSAGIGCPLQIAGVIVGDGETVGLSSGFGFGEIVGLTPGLGDIVGLTSGLGFGDSVGETVGDAVGDVFGDGDRLGDPVAVGDAVGETVCEALALPV